MDTRPARGDARRRILEAAWAITAAEGAAEATVVRVARAAGVSRQAVYLFFGGRAGLLTAMIRDHDRRSGVERRLARAAVLRPPALALDRAIGVWLDYVREVEPVASAIHAAALVDPDVAEAYAERMEAIRRLFRAVLRRLAREGRLASDWTVDSAADYVWALVHPTLWRNLALGRGWPQAKIVARAQGTVRAVMLR